MDNMISITISKIFNYFNEHFYLAVSSKIMTSLKMIGEIKFSKIFTCMNLENYQQWYVKNYFFVLSKSLAYGTIMWMFDKREMKIFYIKHRRKINSQFSTCEMLSLAC